MKAKTKTFQLGDRVALVNQGAFYAMNRGVVVPYYGEHDPENPRVRWDSGWAVTSKAEDLRLLTKEEIAKHPEVSLCDIDKLIIPAVYHKAIARALGLMQIGLEPTSALKEAASENGIEFGVDMERFVQWANKRLSI